MALKDYAGSKTPDPLVIVIADDATMDAKSLEALAALGALAPNRGGPPLLAVVASSSARADAARLTAFTTGDFAGRVRRLQTDVAGAPHP